MMTARELMTENPVTVPVTAKVRAAVRLLHTLDIRHLPVVDEEGALVGIVSDRDLRSLTVPDFVAGEYVGRLQTALDSNVSTFMNSDVLSVEPEADVAEIVELMLEHRVGAVPVAEADGTLVGIVSYMDVLREMPLEEESS